MHISILQLVSILISARDEWIKVYGSNIQYSYYRQYILLVDTVYSVKAAITGYTYNYYNRRMIFDSF